MPTLATDRKRLTLVVIAVGSVALTALSLRVLNAASLAGAKRIPADDLRGLSAYLAPLQDTASLAVPANGSMVGRPDPFGAPTPVRRPAPQSGAPSGASDKGPVAQWLVSSILFEDSKRSAIVDGAWVSVGEPLAGGARLAAIERKHIVVVDARGKRQVVPLQGGPRED